MSLRWDLLDMIDSLLVCKYSCIWLIWLFWSGKFLPCTNDILKIKQLLFAMPVTDFLLWNFEYQLPLKNFSTTYFLKTEYNRYNFRNQAKSKASFFYSGFFAPEIKKHTSDFNQNRFSLCYLLKNGYSYCFIPNLRGIQPGRTCYY